MTSQELYETLRENCVTDEQFIEQVMFWLPEDTLVAMFTDFATDLDIELEDDDA